MTALTAAATKLNNEPNASVIANAVDTFTKAAVADMAALAGGGVTGTVDVHLVDLVTTAALAAGTYNSTAKTFTTTATGAQTIDGVSPVAVGTRILVKDQVTATQNGIYQVTTAGAIGVAQVLTRVADLNTTAAFQPGFVVGAGPAGTTNAKTLWQFTSAAGFVLDTNNATFGLLAAGPATTAPSPHSAAAAVGTSLLYARQDHQHNYQSLSFFIARYVMTSNVANLASFTVAQDGVTGVQGDTVLLVGQSTAAQNGPYVIGAVGGGTAPLTRPSWWSAGSTVVNGCIAKVCEGTAGKNTEWGATATGTVTVDTNDPKFVCVDGNWVRATNVTTLGTESGAAKFIIAGMLTAKYTGIFQVDLDIEYADGTNGDSVTWVLKSDTSAAGVFAGANNVSHAVAGVGAGTIGTNCDIVTVDTNAGAAITYNGAAFNTAAVQLKSNVIPALTGKLSGSSDSFRYHQIVDGSNATTKTPFPIGNTVAFGVSMASTNTVTIASVAMSIRELRAA